MIEIVVAVLVGNVVMLCGSYPFFRRRVVSEYQRGFREGMSFGLKQKLAVPVKEKKESVKDKKDEAKSDHS